MPIALDVLVPLPLPPFRFLAPHGDADGPVGARIAVPWQGGVRLGVVVGIEEVRGAAALDLREAIAWIDRAPWIDPEAARRMEELAAYAGAPAGVLLGNLAAVGLRAELAHEVRSVPGAEGPPFPSERWTPADRAAPEELDLWRRQGLVLERVVLKRPVETVLVAARAADGGLDGGPRANQRAALRALEADGPFPSAAALARAADVPESAARALVAKGYAAYEERPAPPPPLPPLPGAPPLPAAPPGAREALDAPVSAVYGGRRRDRLAAIAPLLRADLAAGRSALVLAPEHAALGEAAAALAATLPPGLLGEGGVAVLSGELDDARRERVWERARSGEPVLLVGTYPALIAPLGALGRVVVLDAGGSSYKLPSGARPFVPTLAARLAAARGVPIVLADAVPAPEIVRPAPPEARLALPLPAARWHATDLSAGGWPISHDLARVLRQVEERGRQAVLLSPRRGFSATLACAACGEPAMCPHCDLPLRYHREGRLLRCHQCGHEQAPPDACPVCGGNEHEPRKGAGTQWLASAARDLLDGLPVYRYDTDHRDDLAPMLDGEPGLLVATTAAFRLPPLPDVALVGVALLDTHLTVSDFRAEEEALRFLLQIPELAPARRPLVVLQTFRPDHPLLELLRSEDPAPGLSAWAAETLARREAYGYPPAAHLGRIQITARERAAAAAFAERVAGGLRAAGGAEEEVLGPAPAPVARVRGSYAFHVLVRSPDEARFRALLERVPRRGSGARVRIDVDPRDVVEYLE